MSIIITGLKKRIDEKFTLKIDNLKFRKGQVYALIGENGSGKSTLLKLISGILKKDEGEITLEGIEQKDIAYLPQKPYIFDFSVSRNIVLGLKNKDEEKHSKLEEIANKLGLEQYINKNATKLSGGEAQRVALARCFIQDKKVYLLDEPMTSLDKDKKVIVENYIGDFAREKDAIVIFTTHEAVPLTSIEGSIIRLKDGCLEEEALNC